MTPADKLLCPQCGELCGEFHEGVCAPCWQANQDALDLHNAEVDRWEKMTEAEREKAIRWAVR